MTFVKAALFSLGLAVLLSLPSRAHSEITASEGPCNGASSAIDVRVHGVRSDRGNVTFLYGDKPRISRQGKENFQATLRCEPGNRESA